jgi:hypothetical protein
MAVYFVTGKLGSGKSLVAVSKIKDKLLKGLPVATNLDINLKNMLGRNKRNTRLFRIPDKPDIQDLVTIGVGNKSYDEDLNGLLVLDECGTWFNSRSWADKSRQEVINWFLHARKLGWDIIFLVQDISIVDKQARLALAEHVVYCRRTDRANIPFIGSLFKMITGSKLPLPKIHLGIVKYGDSQTSLKVDTWTTLGPTLYSSYDTKQQFSDFYENSVYSILPPWHSHGRYTVPYNMRNIMRITKIYFRKWSRVSSFFIGSVLTFSILMATSNNPSKPTNKPFIENNQEALSDIYSGWRIIGFSIFPGQPSEYNFINQNGDSFTSRTMRKKGITIKSRGSCEALLIKGDDYASIYCG